MMFLHYYIVRPIPLRLLLLLMGAISPKAIADQVLKHQLMSALSLGSCPRVVVKTPQGRCTEGDGRCVDEDERGRKFLATLKQGCADGKAGEGQPCLYGVFIDENGHATAVCGPRMMDAKK